MQSELSGIPPVKKKEYIQYSSPQGQDLSRTVAFHHMQYMLASSVQTFQPCYSGKVQNNGLIQWKCYIILIWLSKDTGSLAQTLSLAKSKTMD